jgi:6-phosphofructokinase 1
VRNCHPDWRRRRPGLNAVIRSVVKAASRRGWETIGQDGFEGMLDPIRYQTLDMRDLDGLLFRGGTILGTTNRAGSLPKPASGRNGGSRRHPPPGDGDVRGP